MWTNRKNKGSYENYGHFFNFSSHLNWKNVYFFQKVFFGVFGWFVILVAENNQAVGFIFFSKDVFFMNDGWSLTINKCT